MYWNAIAIIIYVLAYSNIAFADISKVKPLAIYAFAKQNIELHDKDGQYIRTAPSIFEYRKFNKWDRSDTGWAPDSFDVYVILQNTSEEKVSATVVLEIFLKEGKLFMNKNYGVTNISKSLEKAKWQKDKFSKKINKIVLEANELRTVKFESIDLKTIQQKLFNAKGMWLFFIRVDGYLECRFCTIREKVSCTIEVIPGD